MSQLKKIISNILWRSDLPRKYKELEETFLIVSDESINNYNKYKKLQLEVVELGRLLEDYKEKIRKLEAENRSLARQNIRTYREDS